MFDLRPQQSNESSCRRNFVEVDGGGTHVGESRRSAGTEHRDRRLLVPPEPRVKLRKHDVLLPIEADPWRVTNLKVETATLENRSHLQLPVPKAFASGDHLQTYQPRVLGQNRINSAHPELEG